MRIVCEQTILMKYHVLYVIFWKNGKIWNCLCCKLIGGALRVKTAHSIYIVALQMHYWHDNRNKSRLLFSSAEMFKKPLWQTVWTQIRLLL